MEKLLSQPQRNLRSYRCFRRIIPTQVTGVTVWYLFKSGINIGPGALGQRRAYILNAMSAQSRTFICSGNSNYWMTCLQGIEEYTVNPTLIHMGGIS